MRTLAILMGCLVVTLALAGLTCRPSIARSGRSRWNWHIARRPDVTINDAYHVVTIHRGMFWALLVVGVTMVDAGMAP